MNLHISRESRCLTFQGELIIFDAETLYSTLKENIQTFKNWSSIYLDLTQVEKIDSACFQLLISFWKEFREKIVFIGYSPAFEETARMHKLKFIQNS